MATPSLAMIPSAYADSKVYSVLPNNGDGDFTFNRDSSATRVGQNGLIQTVGFFGSEKVTNGDFATDSDWTKETGWTISGGTANFSGGTGNKAIYQTVGITNGKTYKIQYQVSSISAGQVAVRFGGMSGVDEITATTIGTYTGYITATGSANGNIHIEDNDNNFVGSVDNVSVQEVLGDQPRLNYDISNGVVQSCPSLLLEPASTNFVTYSESINQYTPVNGTITPNALTSPEGLLNAVKFAENSANNLHYFDSNSISVTSGTKYTISVFAKYNGRFLTFQGSGALNSAFATFNLQNGTIEQQSVGTASIEEMSNDWYRCMFTVQMSQTGNAVMSILLNDSATGGRSRSYQGDGASGVYLFGFQTEQQSYATSYIPTNGASQTRAAETCNDAGTASTFNSTEGVLYAEISALANDLTNRYIALDSSNSSNYILLRYDTVSNNIAVVYKASGLTGVTLSYVVPDITLLKKIAFKYKDSDFALWIDGVEVATSSAAGRIANPNTFNNATFSVSWNANAHFYGKCKDLRVYNEALTDSQLQTLTT
jgi:hypothetical protein